MPVSAPVTVTDGGVIGDPVRASKVLTVICENFGRRAMVTEVVPVDEMSTVA